TTHGAEQPRHRGRLRPVRLRGRPAPSGACAARSAQDMEWRNLERLPQATEDAWEARRIGGRVIRGKAAVDAAVARWNLLDPLMVSPPGSARFLPVLHVDEYRDRAHRALRRK